MTETDKTVHFYKP